MRAVVLLVPLLLMGATFQGSLVGILGDAAAPPSSTVIASLVVTATSGPAPLGVSFDASGTTDSDGDTTDTFRQLGYAFDAGDGNAATYALTGQLKRRHRGGPMFAYVYETPGVYAAKVRAQNAAGQWDDAEVTITVQDPDTVYAGTNTICVSPTSNFTGCPSGATTQTALPAASAYTGKRVLLQRGASFASPSVRHDQVDYQIGAYGSGAAPVLSGLGILDESFSGTVGQLTERATIYDLDLGTNTLSLPVTYDRVTLLRVTAGSLGSALVGWYVNNVPSGWNASHFYMPRRLIVAESVFQSGSSGSAFELFQGGVIGSTFHSDTGPAHGLRIWVAGRSYFGDSIMGRTAGGGQLSLKLHASGVTICDSTARIVGTALLECATQKVVIARNRMGDASSSSDWIAAIQPQNSGDFADEGLEDVIQEDPLYVRGGQVQLDLVTVGRRLTSRGGTVQGGGAIQQGTVGTSLGNCAQYNSTSPPLPNEWCGPYHLGSAAPPQPDFP